MTVFSEDFLFSEAFNEIIKDIAQNEPAKAVRDTKKWARSFWTPYKSEEDFFETLISPIVIPAKSGAVAIFCGLVTISFVIKAIVHLTDPLQAGRDVLSAGKALGLTGAFAALCIFGPVIGTVATLTRALASILVDETKVTDKASTVNETFKPVDSNEDKVQMKLIFSPV